MKRVVLAAGVLAFLLALAGCTAERSAYYGPRHARAVDSLALLTKADVIKMSQARIGDGVIISMINKSGSRFDLRPDDVVELADSGVTDTVISAMLKTAEPQGEGKQEHAYYVYPPWWGYGYFYDPFWDPWYPSFYLSFGPRYYRPFFGSYAHGSRLRR
jgi:hypothetical protein